MAQGSAVIPCLTGPRFWEGDAHPQILAARAHQVHGLRCDAPPSVGHIDYEIVVDSGESEQRLALLHENVKKFGTVFNTIAPGTHLSGVLRRTEARSKSA